MLHGWTKALAGAVSLCGVLPMTTLADSPNILWSSNAAVSAVAISPDGALLAAWSGSANPQIRIWNTTNGALVRTFSGPPPSSALLAFSPQGDLLASAGPELTETNALVFVRLWSVRDGTLVREIAHQANQFDWVGVITGIVFSPDGQYLAVSDCCPYGHVTVWRVGDGTFSHEFAFNTVGGISAIAISPNGAVIALVEGSNPAVRLHRFSDGAFLGWLAGEGEPTSLAYSTDGSILAVGQGGTSNLIQLWNPANRSLIRNLRGHAAKIVDLGFASDGKTLLSAGADNTIRFWRISDGLSLHTYDQQTLDLTSLAVAAKGGIFGYSRNDGTLLTAYMPLWINNISRTIQLTALHWQGGSGSYQLQRQSGVSNLWQNIGTPTSSTTFMDVFSGPNALYRVQSLPH